MKGNREIENDYLAKRDRIWMGKIYDFLGVKVGLLQNRQDFSDKSSWSLVPEEIGIYLIKVTASDPQDKAENAVIFIVKSTEF